MGRTSIQVTDELADELHDRKDRGDSYEDVIWRALDKADRYDDLETTSEVTEAGVSEGSSTRDSDQGESPASPERPPETPRGAQSESLTNDEMLIPGLDLPGSGDKLLKRQDAVRNAFEFVKENGQATPSELKEEIYPEYDGGYASARSWWKNCVYKAFTQLADEHGVLSKPDTSGIWSYTGDDHE